MTVKQLIRFVFEEISEIKLLLSMCVILNDFILLGFLAFELFWFIRLEIML